MSLISGYYSRSKKLDSAFIRNKVKLYSLHSKDNIEDYENIVIETKHGYIIQKYKRTYPIQTEPYKDINGNLVAILGWLSEKGTLLSSNKLLEDCLAKSARVIENFKGEFIAIFVDERSAQMHVINDRFASQPFYVLQADEGVYFSSNLSFLLNLADIKCKVDIPGWLQVFSYGHTLETRTTFNNIKRIMPATHLTISIDGIQKNQYWQLKFTPRTDLNPLTHSKIVFEAFHSGATLRSKIVQKALIALSGGLDSRLVAGVLPENSDFPAYTFVDSTKASHTPEVRVAAEVSKILELEHHVEQISHGEVSSLANDVIMLTGGLRTLLHPAKAMFYISVLKQLSIPFLLGGGPGDILAGSKIPSIDYLDPDKTEQCVSSFCYKYALSGNELPSTLGLLFREDTLKMYIQKVNNSIFESFENINGPTAAHRVTTWALINRWPAFTFTSPIYNDPDISETFCHLDYRFVDLMLQIPASWLYQRNFYSFMVWNCLPQLRHVAYANTGQPLSGEMMHFDYKLSVPDKVSLPKRLLTKAKYISRRLIDLTTHKTPSYPFHYMLLRDDKKLFTEITEILQSYPKLKMILDEKKCMQFMSYFKAGHLQTKSYEQDAELLGGLANMCYSFNCFNNYLTI